MRLSNLRIRNLVTGEVYQRGERCFRERRVKLLSIDNDRFEAEVTGKMVYRVSVQEISGNLYSSCTCPHWTTCKHAVAAMLAAKEWYEENEPELQRTKLRPNWKKFLKQVIDIDAETPSLPPPPRWRVIYLLHLAQESWSLTPQKAYLRRNNQLGRFSNIGDLDTDSRELLYAPNDPIIISHLQKIDYQSSSFYYNRYFGGSLRFKPNIYHYKYGSRLGPLFDLMRESLIYLAPYEESSTPLTFHPTEARIELKFEQEEDAFRLTPRVILDGVESVLDGAYKVLTGHPIWLLKDKRLIRVGNLQEAALLIPYTKNDGALVIPTEEFPEFLRHAFHSLREIAPIELPSSLVVGRRDQLTGKRLYLSESERYLYLDLKFQYQDVEIDAGEPWPTCYRQVEDRIVQVVRDVQEEEKLLQRLLDTGLRQAARGRLQIIDTKALNWAFNNLSQLQEEGYELVGREALQRFRVRTGEPNVRVAVTDKIDWFDVNIEIDVEGVPLPLKELRRAIRQNKRLVKLADQSLALLSEEWFNKFQHLFHLTVPEETGVRASSVHLTMIDSLFQESAAVFEADDSFYERLAELSNFSTLQPTPLPESLVPIMRN
ncbi:MAG: SNF2 helicase associated domain-containing protein, partial [candidate division KSB1 bacterium]|nr:SNF2 helicase associated domain-containing protein [candidate division KSB1 bacterium]